MNCFSFLSQGPSVRKAICVFLLGMTANVATFAQQSPCHAQNYTVTVEVNGSSCASIVVPGGQIVIIDYDALSRSLNLSDIKPVDLHPSPIYQKRGSIFFSAIHLGEYKLNWRSGAYRARITVR